MCESDQDTRRLVPAGFPNLSSKILDASPTHRPDVVNTPSRSGSTKGSLFGFLRQVLAASTGLKKRGKISAIGQKWTSEVSIRSSLFGVRANILPGSLLEAYSCLESRGMTGTKLLSELDKGN